MKHLLLTAIIIVMGLNIGCATAKVSDNRINDIWQEVRAEFPDRNVDMPEVIWVDQDIYISDQDGERFVNGAYLVSDNRVYLRKWWADENTVEHEFRHAHGEKQGERPGRLSLK